MGRKKVLVIEDDKAIREVLQELLESEGYTVVLAENGEEGLCKLRAEQPQLVTLDLMMPVMDGLGFLSARRAPEYAHVAATPVLLVSAVNDLSAVRDEVAEVVRKPIDLEHFLSLAERYCL